MKYWVIKARPKEYDLKNELIPEEEDEWFTNKKIPDQMQNKDILFIWASSPIKKLVGLAKCGQIEKNDNNGSFYVHYISDYLDTKLDIKFLRLDKQLNKINEPSFLKSGAAGTIFPLLEEQGERLTELLFEYTYDKNLKPNGNKNPSKSNVTTTQYERNEEVKRWILNEANGICECCAKKAPFRKEDNSLFLEIHHIKRLADNGSDTITNTIALCPNCHRELHYGKDKKILIDKIYLKISRLKAE